MHISDAMPACRQQHKTAKFDSLNNKLTLKNRIEQKMEVKYILPATSILAFQA